MEFELTASELRVLSSLIEKEFSTPEYYPLSLNALINACNQKTNRHPVTDYDEQTVLTALAGLKTNRLVWESTAGRVAKYEETFLKLKKLSHSEGAALCELMLRGPQTLGELKTHTERLYAFKDMDEVAATLDSLTELGLALKLARLPGHKESRYTQLLRGEPEQPATSAPTMDDLPRAPGLSERVETLEREVATLSQELSELRQALLDFKQQFD